MNRFILKIAALLTCLCLLLGFAACNDEDDDDDNTSRRRSKKNKTEQTESVESTGKNKEETAIIEKEPLSIVGNWRADVDVTDLVKRDDDTAKYMGDETFELVMYFLFDEDDNVEVTIDTIQLTMDLRDISEKIMRNMLEEKAESEGADLDELLEENSVTYEELVEAFVGCGYDEFFDDMVAEMIDDMDLEDLAISGKFLYEDEKLYLYRAKNGINRNEYMVCTLTEEKLIFEDLFGEGEFTEEFFEGMELYRV